MSQVSYSDVELDSIAQRIVADSKPKLDTVNLGKQVRDDWDDDGYIQQLYEDFLSAVQMGALRKADSLPYGATSTFEGYLRDCQSTLVWRRGELTRELSLCVIDNQTYNNAKMVIDMSEAAITKYFEKTETGRLIGV